MKKILRWLPMVAMMLACSCSELGITFPWEKGDDNNGDKLQKISFSAKINGITRATDLQFETGDKISVFGSTTGSVESENYAQNVCYEYVDKVFMTDEQLWYPDEETALSFYAVYPYGNYTTPTFNFGVELDQREHAKYTASDLMTASTTAKNSEVVDLVFNHRMAKVVINISAEKMPAGEQAVVFNGVKSVAAVDLSSNRFYGMEGTDAQIIAAPNGTNSFKVLLPAQTIPAGSEFLYIIIGEETYLWTIDRDLIFNSGVEYVYDLEIVENSRVAFTAQINPWGTPEQIESVIPEEYLELLEPYIPIHKGTTPPNVEGTYLVSPPTLLTDNVGFDPGFIFADKYIQFYNQTANNTISMRETQLLGDLSVGEGVFISGEGNNFTIYLNEYSTYDDGSWLTSATIISGTLVDGNIQNYTYAFIILDAYDTVDEYMDPGHYRVIYDGNGISTPTEWPLSDTRAAKRATGVSIFAK